LIKRSKWGNKVQKIFDEWTQSELTFHSKKELARWNELNMLQLEGNISNLQRQVPFKIHLNNILGKSVWLCTYYADFTYIEDGKYYVEDVKAKKRDGTFKYICPYPLKKRLLKIVFGIEIKET
jgi:hypothetical protein